MRLLALLLASLAATARADLASWRAAPAAAAPGWLSDIVPSGARVLAARSGEWLRLRGAARPVVGRVWRSGETIVFVDESDLLAAADGGWWYVVPLGAHELVAVAGDVSIERAAALDPGYAWEVYEHALVAWGDGASRADPPVPPSGAARAAWLEARAAAALLAAAGTLDAGGRSLRVAVALDGVARARPLVGPYYRPDGPGLATRALAPGAAAAVAVRGPRWVRIEARAARPGSAAALRVLLDGVPAAGGPLAAGPGAGDEVPVLSAAPSDFVVRVPRGRHVLRLVAAGPAVVAAASFRKREHVSDALTGAESIDGRAAAVLASPSPLAAAEARRLAGRLAEARAAFAALSGDPSPAVRAYAAWRGAELEAEAGAAARRFADAQTALAQLAPDVRAAAAPAIALAAARRDEPPGDALGRHPELWGEREAAAAIAADDRDVGTAAARLAAAVAAAPLRGAAALRRVFYDRTAWRAAPLRAPSLLLLTRDSSPGRCEPDPLAYERVGARPRQVVIPADPLGSSRFLSVRVAAFAPARAALEAELLVDGQSVPVPVLAPAEEHRVALAAGAHTVAARGAADLYLRVPGGAVDTGPDAQCDRRHRRRYAVVGDEAVDLGVAAPSGAILGLDLRLLDPAPRQPIDAMLRLDGRTRRVRLRGDGTAGGTASPAVIVDLVARDPRSVTLARLGPDGGQRLLVRPLVRITRAAQAGGDDRTAELAERLLASIPVPPPSADGLPGGLRRLTRELRAARDPDARARLLVARARLLAQAGHPAYADEDLGRAAALVPAYQPLVDATRSYVEPVTGAPGYAVEPTAAVLRSLRDDPTARAAAARAYAGASPVAGPATGPPQRAVDGGRDDATLAIVALRDERDGSPAGAAAAYAELARRRPEEPRLSAAEATARLDDASRARSPGAATRAYVAALRARGAPGAADALARAADATRWRAVTHADEAAGSQRAATPAAPADRPALEVRAALLDPDLGADDALWLESGATARALLTLPRATRVTVDSRCAELRPGAALARVPAASGGGGGVCSEGALCRSEDAATGPPQRAVDGVPACGLTLRVDGQPRADAASGGGGGVWSGGALCRSEDAAIGPPQRAVSCVVLPAGEHAIELSLAPGGLDALAAVRFLVPGPLPGADVRPTGDGRFRLGARLEESRFLADRDEPVAISVLGPTVLRVDAAGGGAVTVADAAAGRPLAAVAADPAGRADVILPEERPYRLELRPERGRAAVAAAVREDRAAPLPRLEVALLEDPPPGALPAPGAPPRVPRDDVRFVSDGEAPGTLTLAEILRDGHVGDREEAAGGRFAETALSYRRRNDDLWWRVDAFGRLRPVGAASGGFGARGLWAVGELRLSGGALGVTQSTATGQAITGWLDLGTALRHPLGRDLFLTPSLGWLMRDGPYESPGGDGIDPDVWSAYDADRPQQLWGQVRLDWEPFLDLHAHGRARAVGAAGGLDRAGALVGVTGVLARFGWGASIELERRFALLSRLYTYDQPVLRLGMSYAVWRHGSDRLALGLGTAVRPGDRVAAFLSLSYDWTFGRGLLDYAPDDQEYAAQLGPYAEEP